MVRSIASPSRSNTGREESRDSSAICSVTGADAATIASRHASHRTALLPKWTRIGFWLTPAAAAILRRSALSYPTPANAEVAAFSSERRPFARPLAGRPRGARAAVAAVSGFEGMATALYMFKCTYMERASRASTR